MSSRVGRSNPPPPASNRQNEYFVPRDGIDREVITADICRYLGNDALVRPGVYEAQTGQVVQGYFITAYRNLTTAMIEDLKADSARWDQERRQQTARNPVGGTIAASDANGLFIKKSNSPIVQYRNSDTHQSRQYYGPTEGSGPAAYQGDSRDAMHDSTPRYPGTGNAGYTGAAGSYSNQSFGNQGGYGAQQGYGSAQPPQFSPSTADMTYQRDVAMAGTGNYQPNAERPYTQVNTHMRVSGADPSSIYGTSDPYSAGPRGIPASSMAQGRPTYVTSGPPPQAFPPSSSGPGYYTPSASAPTSQFAQVQPQDPFYGRGTCTKRL
ncbi:uncharacterized protein BCR38DRAFT_43366 [Pseudomassariella vexata]|uniref:Transcription factor RfeG n=1 Tax=Pseudomassariella vexata TaxID=1141098 RepID=A0A1Y2DN00_9PEZI|nr:uncharacterized protein BCR38DRAFT_43366 [Pseudomassariella vexata]ORY60631.1 hypothetical protein BCR38DRAFT_43366 [Pseudomassariella vexata]